MPTYKNITNHCPSGVHMHLRRSDWAKKNFLCLFLNNFKAWSTYAVQSVIAALQILIHALSLSMSRNSCIQDNEKLSSILGPLLIRKQDDVLFDFKEIFQIAMQ